MFSSIFSAAKFMVNTSRFIHIIVSGISSAQFTSAFAALVIISFCVQMKRWNTGRGDSILLVGMHMGYLIGSWFNQSEYSIALMGLFSARVHNHSLPVSSNATTVLYRMAVGLPLVFIIRLAIRMMVLNVIFLIAREDTSNAEAIKKPNIELFHKYFSYFLLGFTGVALVPVFASLGL